MYYCTLLSVGSVIRTRIIRTSCIIPTWYIPGIYVYQVPPVYQVWSWFMILRSLGRVHHSTCSTSLARRWRDRTININTRRTAVVLHGCPMPIIQVLVYHSHSRFTYWHCSSSTSKCVARVVPLLPWVYVLHIKPFSTAVPIWGQTTLIPSELSPKRDWGPERVKPFFRSRVRIKNSH